MLHYSTGPKDKSRELRKKLTESESVLWSRLRRKQLLGIQFYRQKPIGQYIVDFFAPRAKLVVEVDGSQHAEEDYLRRDENRDEYLTGLGLKVLRFNSRAVLTETDAVVAVIYWAIAKQLNSEIPPTPLSQRGDKTEAFFKARIRKKAFSRGDKKETLERKE
jgi:very-short-patch-repair endonuclease